MFTGLIEELGRIKSISQIGGGKKIIVSANLILAGCKVDDSIAINGVCQTVIDLKPDSFSVVAVEETLKKSTLGSFQTGRKVNLERAMKLSDRLGGHLVQGHIDCRGKVASIEKLSTAVLLWISYPIEFAKFLVDSGSITIDGVSLTSAKVDKDKFMVSIIPHTWQVTALSNLKTADYVNLEFDILGKYINRMLSLGHNSDESKASSLSQYIDQPEY